MNIIILLTNLLESIKNNFFRIIVIVVLLLDLTILLRAFNLFFNPEILPGAPNEYFARVNHYTNETVVNEDIILKGVKYHFDNNGIGKRVK